MSVLRKKGQRALTHKQQRRNERDLLTKSRWKAWRTFVHYTQANSRPPIQKAFRGIVGRKTEAQRDRDYYRQMVRGTRR